MKMKNLSIVCMLQLSAFLSACNASPIEYGVEGLSDRFCLPEKYAPSTPFWMPIDPSEYSRGFFVSGCWKPGLHDESCELPPHVLSVGVSSKSNFSGWLWQDFPEDSFIRRLPTRAGTKIETVGQENLVVVYNENLWGSKYVWRKAEENQSSALSLGDGDSLEAICAQENAVNSDGTKINPTICERRVLGRDYYISYKFESNAPTPLSLSSLDEKIFRTLDKWRCK